MAAAKGSSSSGKGIKKKVGPLPAWGWVAVAGGTFLVYRYLRARSAANAALAASGTTGGTTIPAGQSAAGQGASGAGSFATQAAWEQALLTFLTGNGLSAGDAYHAMTAFLNGNCVSAPAYQAISAALTSTTVGLPPGFNAPPTLSVCPTAPNPGTFPPVNAAKWPSLVEFRQLAPGEFTKIGTVEAGVSDAPNVRGGVPVYASTPFGGIVQGFDTARLPNGTGIYIPTIFLPYLTGPIGR